MAKSEWRELAHKNALQIRLLQHYQDAGSPRLKDLALTVGISASRLLHWLGAPNRALPTDGLEKVAAWVNVSYEEALAEQGGKTAEERRRCSPGRPGTTPTRPRVPVNRYVYD